VISPRACGDRRWSPYQGGNQVEASGIVKKLYVTRATGTEGQLLAELDKEEIESSPCAGARPVEASEASAKAARRTWSERRSMRKVRTYPC